MVPNNWFTGPVTANNVANNTATDDAISIFGRYKITFTAPVPFNFNLKSVNQEANNKEIKICGIKPNNQSKNVLPKYFKTSPSVKILRNCQIQQTVLPFPVSLHTLNKNFYKTS